MNKIDQSYHTKNRIVAVDIVRLLAAFIVMYSHLLYSNVFEKTVFEPLTGVLKLICGSGVSLFYNPSSLFFLLAGYFASRNITWKKALNNSFWCLAPYLFWCTVAIVVFSLLQPIPPGSSLLSWLGLKTIVFGWFALPEWLVGANASGYPVNAPLWFMRDLVFLFLLSPILFKYAKWLFPFLVIVSCIPFCQSYFMHNACNMMSPYSILYFLAGCWLRGGKDEHQKKLLSFSSVPFILCFVAAKIIFTHYDIWPALFISSLTGTWVLYQCARWIELNVPHAREWGLKFAPVTFLTFATHWIIYPLLPSAGGGGGYFLYTR